MAMQTLQSFYRSKEWEAFRRVVILQATDPQTGFVSCAHCGKPILKKYDLVVHHVEPLTEGNVNDALVSLNPANCVCVHFRCHNAIHERWQGGNGGWRPKPRMVHLVYGAPCAGKSSWVRDNIQRGDLVVDIDSIWESVSGLDRYDKPDGLKGVVFRLHDELCDMVRTRAGKWRTAFVIAGVPRRVDRQRLAVRVGADDCLYVEATQADCMERLNNAGDRSLERWGGYIDDWFSRYQPDE
jgi:hypothetical protein